MRLPQLELPRLVNLARVLGEDILGALYPALCPLCGADSSPACAAGACEQHRLPLPSERLPGPRCERCAQALPPMLPNGTRCARCRRRRPRAARVVALGDYHADEALREWVLALKHRRRRDLAEPLGRALAARLLNQLGAPPRSAMLVPVPLHPLRRMQRGFDQAWLLARAVAQVLDLPLRPLLVRRRWTPPQGAAGSPARGANPAGAFAVPDRRARELSGLRIWLVDDVITSGATIDACATLLAEHGARQIGVLCLARAGEVEMFD